MEFSRRAAHRLRELGALRGRRRFLTAGPFTSSRQLRLQGTRAERTRLWSAASEKLGTGSVSLSDVTVDAEVDAVVDAVVDAAGMDDLQQAHFFSVSGEKSEEYVCGKLSCAKLEEESNEGSWMDLVPSRVRGLIMLNVLVLLCGTNWVVVKEAGEWDPYVFCSLRFIVAALFFSPVFSRAAKNPEVVRGGVEIGIYTATGYLLQAEGLLTTDASRASFLSTFTVLVVPFLAGLSGRGVKPITWASAFAALVGVGLLEQSGSAPSIGDLWSAISAMFFGVQMFRTEHYARTLGKDSGFDLMGAILATTAVITTGAALATHSGSFHMEQLNTVPWGEVFYCGLLTTDVVLLMEVFALQDVSSVEASIIYTLEPVVGACFACLLLNERIGGLGVLGAVIILISCMATQLLGAESEVEAKAD